MSTALWDPFMITQLPRLPSKGGLGSSCTIAHIDSMLSMQFDVGVSGSYIGSYITKPTPKMIWSYSLSPQSRVDCLDSFTFDESADKDESKLFVAGINERKKSSMRIISYGRSKSESEDDKNTTESLSAYNEEERNTVEPEGLREVRSKDVSLKEDLIGLRISKDGNNVYTVSKKGRICIWELKVEDEITEKVIYELEPTKKRNLIYHCFISPEELQIEKSENIEHLLLTVEDNGGLLNVGLYAIDKTSVLELSQSVIELNISDNAQFCFDPSGKLLILENDQDLTLQVYSVPFAKKLRTIELINAFSTEPQEQPISIAAVSTNRVLISKGSTIALVDIQFEALLGSIDLYPKSKNSNGLKFPRTATIQSCVKVKGNSLRTRDTFALVLLKSPKDNFTSLQHLSVDVGLGKLTNVLGRGIKKAEKPASKFAGFPTLVNKSEFKSSAKESNSLQTRSRQSSTLTAKMYDTLQTLKSKKKYQELETHLVNFLKNIDETESSEPIPQQQPFMVYEADQDRVVDPEFIRQVLLLLLDFKDNRLQLPNYEVENSLTYLLTHPLFPPELVPGLLQSLTEAPRLMRQAIVTCPNIPCGDLIELLSAVADEEVFKDIIARLLEDFSNETITQETAKMLKKNVAIDLDGIISRILKLNYGYEILNNFIDSDGLVLSLHYSKNQTQLENLIAKTQAKVDALVTDTQLLTLVNQSLSITEQSRKKKQKKRKDVDINNTSIVEETTNLDSLLQLAPGSMKKDDSRRIPLYSVEKLNI
ncbi:hypothetical protein OGAPHI_006211 [Ogataea philodendri]|uniref:Uncharacterized protein n=1 Tax=Ogataea philodendri TaxID=1378263 RepID=A0A9P8T1K0_9ASCO|nr:uncharacterized protein OGAPHI_006211 [Ogataea philodendri]KAH3662030.1 hypothetical protein OGAPHI_006211 [Ogataea philodendri]